MKCLLGGCLQENGMTPKLKLKEVLCLEAGSLWHGFSCEHAQLSCWAQAIGSNDIKTPLRVHFLKKKVSLSRRETDYVNRWLTS